MPATFRRFSTVLTRPQSLLIIIALIFGGIFISTTPPLFGVDESTHFLRAYDISEGQLVEQHHGKHVGAYLPSELGTLQQQVQSDLYANLAKPKEPNWSIYNSHKQALDTKDKQWVYFEGAAAYPPLPYIPQAIGIKIGTLTHLSLVKIVYLGRICNLLAWITLVFLAIRLAAFGKWAFLTIALIPMSLYQAASLSPDALTIALGLLVISLTTQLMVRAEKYKWPQLTGVAITVLLLAFTKQVYFVFVFLLWLLPISKFKSKWSYIMYNLLTTGLVLILTGGWYEYVKNAMTTGVATQRPGVIIDFNTQLSYLLHHPYFIPIIFVNTLLNYSNQLFVEFAGDFSWTFIPLPNFSVIAVFVTVFIALFVETPRTIANKLKPLARRGALGVATVGVIAICTVFYLTFTRVGAHSIEGLQGRYFLPLAGLLIVGCVNNKFYLKVAPRTLSTILALLIILNLFVASYVVWERNFHVFIQRALFI